MKRILTALALACAAGSSFGATLNPVQLLNPAGSSSGQTIVSTGASTAPGWGNVPIANVTGGAPLASPPFTGTVSITNTSGNSLVVNAASNAAGATLFLGGNGGTTPNKYVRAFNGAFQIVNSGNSATPMSMDDAGNVTFSGSVTGTAGSFSTLSASGLATLSGGIAGNTTGTAASAGTVGEVPSATFTSVGMTTSTVQNLTSLNLTAGVYLVWGSATYVVGTGATMNIWLAGVSQTTGALPALGTYFQQSNGAITATGAATANAPMYLLTLTSAKTIYLTGEAVFSGGAVTATGFLAALRIH